MTLVHFVLAVILLTFAGVTRGMTPPGTSPANNGSLTAAFENLLAVNGANITITEAKNAPVLGLSKLSSDTFTVFMVDLDADFLHWAQTGLTTSATSMTVSGTTFYPLVNSGNATALQTYITPGPPAGPAHRYTQYLMITTNMSDLVVSQSVATALQSRVGLNVSQLFSETGRTLMASNWWNTSRTATSTSSSNSTSNTTLSTGGALSSTTHFRDTIPLLGGLGGLAVIFSFL